MASKHSRMGDLMMLIAGLMLSGAAIWSLMWVMTPKHTHCKFDRNELGPMGTYGQWYWDVYKCSDGTERRMLVAGPRG